MGADSGAGAAGSAALIVVNYASSALLARNLAPLTRETGVLAIVVDNYSSDIERTRIRQLADAEGWNLVAMPGNPGFGTGVNAGVAAATATGADRLVVINPDARLAATDLFSLLTALSATEQVVVAPEVLRPDGSVWSAGCDLYLADGRIRATRHRLPVPAAELIPWLSGACFALTGATWDAVGGFSDDYFLYWEDVDFCYRAARAGVQLRLIPGARAVHAEGGTQSEGLARSGQAKSGTYYRYNIRNRLLFGARFLDRRRWRAWLWATPAVSWEILLQGGRRQLVRSPEPLLSALGGLASGLLAAGRERRRAR